MSPRHRELGDRIARRTTDASTSRTTHADPWRPPALRALLVAAVLAAGLAIVAAPATAQEFNVTEVTADDPVTEGEPVTVTVSVANEGRYEETQIVAISFGGHEAIDSQHVTLDSGDTATVTLQWTTGDTDWDERNVTLNATTYDDYEHVTVHVLRANDEPRLQLEQSILKPSTATEITFTADASDPDGNVTSTSWRIDGEPVASGRTFTHVFDEPGVYQVGARVTDDEGDETGLSREVVIEDASANQRPTATANYYVEDHDDGWQVTLTGEGSDAEDSSAALELAWHRDGERLTGNAQHRPVLTSPGVYRYRLSATDTAAATGWANVTVVVGNGTEALDPAIRAPDTVVAGDTATLTVDHAAPEAAGAYDWWIDGDAAGEGRNLTHGFAAGDHTVAVAVTTRRGKTARASRQIEVVEPATASTAEESDDDPSRNATDGTGANESRDGGTGDDGGPSGLPEPGFGALAALVAATVIGTGRLHRGPG